MLFGRYKLAMAFAGLWLCAAPAVRAEAIHEPNNSPSTAYVLPAGQWIVNDDLNGAAGRANTILGHYNPSYSTLLDANDDSPDAGTGTGSKLVGVPLLANGSAYFSITGAPDVAFIGAHSQLGKYRITYDIYTPTHVLYNSYSKEEWVTPMMVDNDWINPNNAIPNWSGYTVDVTVNNVVGKGNGDSLDYFLFTGLDPNAPFTVQLTDAQFDAIIGLYNPFNQLVSTGTLQGGKLTLTGFADGLGRVKVGVTGAGDTGFIGEHAKVGTYTLELFAVPEPASGVLLACGAALCGLWACRRRGGRRRRGI